MRAVQVQQKEKMEPEAISCSCAGTKIEKSRSGWRIGNVLSYLCNPSKELNMAAAMELIQFYYENLMIFFSKEGLPPDLRAIFDIVLQYDHGELWNPAGSMSINVSKLEGIPTEGDLVVFQLQKLLIASLELIGRIAVINAKIHEGIGETGVILRDTPLQKLASSYSREIIQLLKRLEVAVNFFQEDFTGIINDETVTQALKLSAGRWLSQLFKSVEHDIYYSIVSKIEGLTSMGCGSVARLSASLCCLIKKLPFCATHHKKYVAMLSFACLSMKDGLMNFEYLERSYDEAIENVKTEKPTKLVSFSKGNKVKKQCDLMLNWCQQFEAHVQLQKSYTLDLIKFEDDLKSIDDHNKVVDKLQKAQSQANCFAREMQNMLDAQAVLILDLRRGGCDASSSTNTSDSVITVVTRSELERRNTGDCSEDDSHLGVSHQLEYSTADNHDGAVLTEQAANQDEVFVAVFRDDDCVEVSAAEEEFLRDEKHAEKLFSGVVSQLKDRLEPVKTKMLEREKDAVTKVFGDVTEDIGALEDLQEMNNKHDEQESGYGESKYFNGNENGDELSTPNSGCVEECSGGFQTSPDFFSELKLKIASRYPARGQNQTEEYELDVSTDSD